MEHTATAVDPTWTDLLDKLEQEQQLTPQEWVRFIADRTPEGAQLLFTRARAIRESHYGRKVFVRGLIEFTNYCKNDCLYCGIRKSNKKSNRYRLDEAQIMNCCARGYDLGFRTFVLQGGEDPYYTDARLVPLVARIRAAFPDCAITLSVGERSHESYQALFDAGADRYLLRHETADPCHYASLHPSEMTFAERADCLQNLRSIGFQVGSGFMVGSPGQGPEQLAADMAFLKQLNPHMIGIGPFIPHTNTPFANEEGGTLELTLFMLACLRLMLPKVLLPATTALGTIHPQGREMGMDAGANVVMPNLSPLEHRDDYSLYEGKAHSGAEAAEGLELLRTAMAKVGYTVVVDRGDSLVD